MLFSLIFPLSERVKLLMARGRVEPGLCTYVVCQLSPRVSAKILYRIVLTDFRKGFELIRRGAKANVV